jgi:hypothetical protein
MGLSNYPVGVTGREYEIAGPDSETEEPEDCSFCDWQGVALVLRYGFQAWYDCPKCGTENDVTDYQDFGPDPDALLDEAREREALGW